MKSLSRDEMKNVKGGVFASCTYTLNCTNGGSVSCTSAKGNCHWMYCNTDAANVNCKTGVSCDEKDYKC